MLSGELFIAPRLAVGETAWNALVERSPEAWLWHRWEYIDAMATWPSREDRSLAVVDSDATVIAVLPLQLVSTRRSKIVSYRILDSPGGIATDPILSPQLQAEAQAILLDEISAVATRERIAETQFAISPVTPSHRPPHTPAANPLLAIGFEDSSSSSWIVALSDDKDAAWRGLEGRARTAIRKARRSGVTVRRATASDLSAYYSLHLATCYRRKLTPHPQSYFEAIFDLIERGLARIWLAEVNGSTVAGANFGWYKQATWYWTGASNDQGLRSEANSLLHWTAISEMCDTGIDFYETGEAFLEPVGGDLYRLSTFKRSFGGELSPLFRGRRVHRPVLTQVLDQSRRLYRWFK